MKKLIGSIDEIAESYPLQITIESEGKLFYFSFHENTEVWKEGDKVSVSFLIPGIFVEVFYESSNLANIGTIYKVVIL